MSAALAGGTYAAGVFETLELDTVDARFSFRGAQAPPPELIVVQIDDVTFDELGVQWPFPRSLHGKVIDRIAAGDPKAIGIDIQFTEATVPKEDNALIEAVARAGNVVLATTEVDEITGGSNVFGGEEVLREIGAFSGNALVVGDDDAVIRRMAHRIDGLKTFPVVIAEVATGREIRASELHGSTTWIDFAGPPRTFETVSYSRVLAGKVDPSRFAGKIVVVGPSAPSLQDVHFTATAGDEPMSGAELQANAVLTALNGFPLQGPSLPVDILLIVALALFAPVVSLRWPAVRTFLAAVAAGAAFTVATQFAFEQGQVLTFVYPLVALAAAAVGALAVHYLLEAFERERVRDMFARFVPEPVVDQALGMADGIRLGGARMTGTCMFTDLRGFTSFSEKLGPDEVIFILNRYLTEMSDAILENGGTLVSYMGDGIFAVFGAPIAQPDHADRALETARQMLEERLPRFNEWIGSQGHPPVKMGIGLNSGEFMSGNVGSERRLEYAAIGDVTNTASRLEGMTKGTPHSLFMSEETCDALTRPWPGLFFVDEFEVRGREAKIRLWSMEMTPQEAPAEAPEPVEAPAATQPA